MQVPFLFLNFLRCVVSFKLQQTEFCSQIELSLPLCQNPYQNKTIMTFWKTNVHDPVGWHYWGGVPYSYDTYDDYAMCACGLTKSCVEPNINCNCDERDESGDLLQDDGFLEYSQHLPVRGFYAGDTGACWAGTLSISKTTTAPRNANHNAPGREKRILSCFLDVEVQSILVDWTFDCLPCSHRRLCSDVFLVEA